MQGNVKTFHQMLNSSVKDRYDFWKNYRDKVTTFILNNHEKTYFESTLILGAGHCYDIDLQKLSHYTDHICLSDIDHHALSLAKNKYPDIRKKITIETHDYLGLNQADDWNNLVRKIVDCPTKENIDAIFERLNQITLHHVFLENYDASFDFVIISPIYTQFILQQALNYIEILDQLNLETTLQKHIFDHVMKWIPKVIDRFNINVLKLVNSHGELFVLSDVFECKPHSEFYQNIQKIISDVKQMNKFSENYHKTYGSSLGYFGLSSMLQRTSLLDEQWFVWNFSKERYFIVKALLLKKHQ